MDRLPYHGTVVVAVAPVWSLQVVLGCGALHNYGLIPHIGVETPRGLKKDSAMARAEKRSLPTLANFAKLLCGPRQQLADIVTVIDPRERKDARSQSEARTNYDPALPCWPVEADDNSLGGTGHAHLIGR